MLRTVLLVLLTGLVLAPATVIVAAPTHKAAHPAPPTPPADAAPPADTSDDTAVTDGTVTIGGKPVHYQATAGTIIVHPEGWDDPRRGVASDDLPPKDKADADKAAPEAAMFYVAYRRTSVPAEQRPITFLYNGGPGSSTVWLHMGAFGPRRVRIADASHAPAAPYALVDNGQSLLDASDLVFIDAPGTGFGRLAGHDATKAFWGVDGDAHAFADFITQFLSRTGRWNSPKYLFGESYGTTRSAVLADILETQYDTDLNGVILLSQYLSADLAPDDPATNPGNELPYILALPTYAATAWVHHKLDPSRTDLSSLLADAEHFATTDYARALAEGAALAPERRDAIAARLHDFTGLPVSYIQRADLRIDGGEFEQNLLGADDTTTGRLDTRFTGPTMDPLGKAAQYDPQGAAISSAYVSSFNDYVRRTLHFGRDRVYRAEIDIKDWDDSHQPPGSTAKLQQSTNVMPDLAHALVYDPKLRVMLNAGYFDLATPYAAGLYEMRHLPMPRRLQANIEYRQYRSGHMVYVNETALRQLHDNVADFIARTSNLH